MTIITEKELLERRNTKCEELMKIYDKWDAYVNGGKKKDNSSERFLNFYRGVNCTKILFREGWSLLHEDDINLKNEVINNEERIAFVSDPYNGNAWSSYYPEWGITDKDKYISCGSTLDPTRLGGEMSMQQATPEGIYDLRISMHHSPEVSFQNRFYFYDNSSLFTAAAKNGLTLDEIKYRMTHGGSYSVDITQKFPLPVKFNSYTDEEKMMLWNKIYREGLVRIAELARSGKYVEITDEDRKFYKITEDEKRIIEEFGKIPVSIEEFVKPAKASEKNEEHVRESYSPNNGASKTEILQNLTLLKELDIELSPEQKSMCELYEKLNSEKFQQYKANSEARKEKQEQVRNEIAAENERKAEWQNSPDNLSNRRIEELQLMKKRMDILENVRSIDDSLLTQEQIELMERSKKFFEMLDIANLEQHEVDTGMSPEIRNWYQQHYSEEENIAKK